MFVASLTSTRSSFPPASPTTRRGTALPKRESKRKVAEAHYSRAMFHNVSDTTSNVMDEIRLSARDDLAHVGEDLMGRDVEGLLLLAEVVATNYAEAVFEDAESRFRACRDPLRRAVRHAFRPRIAPTLPILRWTEGDGRLKLLHTELKRGGHRGRRPRPSHRSARR